MSPRNLNVLLVWINVLKTESDIEPARFLGHGSTVLNLLEQGQNCRLDTKITEQCWFIV